MKTEAIIKELISTLDESKDPVLVMALKDKIYRDEQTELGKVSFTDKELRRSKNDCAKMVNNYLSEALENDPAYQKIESILSRFECEECRFSIKKTSTYSHYGSNIYHDFIGSDDTDRCRRCNRKQCKLHDINYERMNSFYRFSHDFISSERNREIVECKIIAGKIIKRTQEIKNYHKQLLTKI